MCRTVTLYHLTGFNKQRNGVSFPRKETKSDQGYLKTFRQEEHVNRSSSNFSFFDGLVAFRACSAKRWTGKGDSRLSFIAGGFTKTRHERKGIAPALAPNKIIYST
jgi:hypothetical protein